MANDIDVTPPSTPDAVAILRAATAYQIQLWDRMMNRARLRIGAWILGGGWFGAITRLQLIHQRAEKAVMRDGSVVLADCEALAEALYGEVPGIWTLTVRRTDEEAGPLPVQRSSEDSSNAV